MSNLITYLLIGLILNFTFDLLSDHLESKTKFNLKEKAIMVVSWPIVLITFIYHFTKTIGNGKP
jgi:hypothetical protein